MTLEPICNDELFAALRAFPTPRRILSVEPSASPELRRLFPRAVVRDGALAAPSAWTGWPDLLWVGAELRGDVEAVRCAWRAVPEGAFVVALEPHGDDLRDLLRECFALIATVEPDPGAVRGHVAVKTIDREW